MILCLIQDPSSSKRAIQPSLNYIEKIQVQMRYLNMFTFNIFAMHLIMLHKIGFSCSPINKNRFEKEFFNLTYADVDCELSSGEKEKIIEIQQNENYILWSLRHPLLAIRLIKRYHMIGNIPIIAHIMLILLLSHLSLKFSLFFKFSDDKASLEYYKSIYYPHIAHFSRNPNKYRSTTLSFALLLLCIRLTNVGKLLKHSIINANYYKEIHVPQLNLAYMASLNFTPSQWLEYWKHASNHRRAIKNDEVNYRNHLRFNLPTHDQLSKYYKKNFVYYYNLIDFEECYSGLEFIKSSERQLKNERAWHTAYPIDRLSHVDIQYFLPILFNLTISVFCGLLISCAALFYGDLASYYPDEYSPSLVDLMRIIPKHFSSIPHIIRQLELSLYFFSQLPQIYESVKVATDVFLTDSRANKVVAIFREHLKYCRLIERESLRMLITTGFDTEQIMFNRNFIPLNRRILRDIGLARTVYLEFLNVREYHTTFLNMLVLGSGVCLPLIVPIAMIESDYPELIVLLLSFTSCIAPMLINLLFCARIEHTVSVESQPSYHHHFISSTSLTTSLYLTSSRICTSS